VNHVYFLARQSQRGMHCYRSYHCLDLIAESKSYIRPRFYPVNISVGPLELDGTVDIDRTIFPGMETVIHCSDGREPARVIYLGDRRHRLVWGSAELEVRYRNLSWKFFLNGKHLASMIPVNSTDLTSLLSEESWTPRYTMMSRVELPKTLAALMLHFPLLQPGL